MSTDEVIETKRKSLAIDGDTYWKLREICAKERRTPLAKQDAAKGTRTADGLEVAEVSLEEQP